MLFSRKKLTGKHFSLIELLIVIGIMGALAALILPSFSDAESDAKDTTCDYNQAGTLRYLNMFKAANGVYPSGFHTGLDDSGAILDNLTTASTYNFGTASAIGALSAEEVESLENAGIAKLAYDKTGLASSISTTSNVCTVDTTPYWTEEVDADGNIVPTGAALTFRGASLSDIAALGATALASYDPTAAVGSIAAGSATVFRSENEPAFVIVPLFVAPTVNWEHYYSDGENDSKISIALVGKCPWGDDGTARYYIAFFKVYSEANADGEIPAAKLLATSCPDCGILEGDLF